MNNKSFSQSTKAFPSIQQLEIPQPKDEQPNRKTAVECIEDKPACLEQTPLPPPDGGSHAWLQVLGTFFLDFNSWGIALSYGVFQTYYESAFPSVSASSLSWIGSLQIFLLVAVGVISGPLYDLGYFRVLIHTGSFLVVFGIMMTSLCTQYWELILAQGLTMGIGAGCLFVPGIAILPTYFTSKRALAQGLGAAGSSLGGVIYPMIFRQLQPKIGFPWTTRIIGFIALTTLMIPVTVMRMRFKPLSRRALYDATAWKDTPYVLFSIGQFFCFMGMHIPYVYLQTYAIRLGITSVDVGFYLLSVVNAGSIAGRIIPNFIADKTGPLNMLIPASAITAIVIFAWIGIQNEAGLIVFGLLFGFFSGTFVSLPAVAIVNLSPNLGVIGGRLGMAFFLTSLGLLIGAPIAGAILNHGWSGLQAWGGACVAIGCMAVLGARTAKVGYILRIRC